MQSQDAPGEIGVNAGAPSHSIPRRRFVGQSVLRVEDPPLLKGAGKFLDDVAVTKDTLHAAVLRSPLPHADIVSIDVSAALRQPGVRAVVTRKEVLDLTDPFIVPFAKPIDYRGIALDRVRYVGEPVAIVCATDRYKAEDALEHIRVDYRPLPAVVDPLRAATPEAPVLHPAVGTNMVSRRVHRHGDPLEFANGTRRAQLTIQYPRNSITPMEGYALVAEYLPDTGGYDVLSNFQGPFSMHPVMARALRVPGSRLRHRSPRDSGGSFGSKLTLYPYIVIMCIAARIAGRPVKWVEDRLEHLAAASVAANRVTEVEASYDDDGVVKGLRLVHWDDNGAYLRAPMPAPIYRMHGLSTNCYRIGFVEIINHIVLTNKCPSGAVRGFGGPQLYFAIERMMHKIAVELGLDPLEVIRRNLIPPDAFPYRAPAGALIDSGDYARTIELAARDGGLEELKALRDRARSEGRLYGIGYAVAVEPSQSNMGYIATFKTGAERDRAGQKDGAIAAATVSMDPLGAVSVVADSVPQGQGHQTALAQVVADRLGVRIEDVVINLEIDTQKDGWSIASGNYSSRFAPAVASAVDIAAERLRDKLAVIAAPLLQALPEEIEFANGTVFARGKPDFAMSLHRVAGLAHWSPASLNAGVAPGLRESVTWSAPELTPTSAKDEINTSLAYGFCFDFCGVEVDPDTGEVRVDNYVTAHDCGTIINPGLVDGQIGGSFITAIGASLYEDFVYAEDGSFLSGTFADYLVPSAAEAPALKILHQVETPSPFTRLGAKGVGEGNQFTTPVCIANAIADALGREDISVPLRPSKVFEWMYDSEPPRRGHDTARASDRAGGLSGRGEQIVPKSVEEVWQALLDESILARAIPGCERLARVGENAYEAALTMGVGPIRGRFDATVRFSELDPPHAALLSGRLIGPLGASSGRGRLRLEPVPEGTRVSYEYEVQLSGTLAMVGARMLDSAGRKLIAEFFKHFVKALAGVAPQPSGDAGWAALVLQWLKRAFGVGS